MKLRTQNTANAWLMGQYGGELVNDTNSRTGEWYAILVIEDATFTSLTGNVVNANAVTYPAGTVIFGLFTEFTLASGAVIAYKTSE